jgi:hypothetical protein
MAHLLILRGAIGSGKTSAGAELLRRRPSLAVIEVDELKRYRYGTTGTCVPHLEFPEAGRLTRDALDAGRHAILIEPLCDEEHVRLVLAAAAREEGSKDVSFAWLECTIDTALARTASLFAPDVVAAQFARYATRHRPRGERVIATDRLSVAQVADALQALIPR